MGAGQGILFLGVQVQKKYIPENYLFDWLTGNSSCQSICLVIPSICLCLVQSVSLFTRTCQFVLFFSQFVALSIRLSIFDNHLVCQSVIPFVALLSTRLSLFDNHLLCQSVIPFVALLSTCLSLFDNHILCQSVIPFVALLSTCLSIFDNHLTCLGRHSGSCPASW